MKINLPEVDWQRHEWTIPSQIAKIMEEAGEVAEAIANKDDINTIREALDTAQTCFTLIDMVLSKSASVDKAWLWQQLLSKSVSVNKAWLWQRLLSNTVSVDKAWLWQQLLTQHEAKLRDKGYLKTPGVK